MKRLILIPFLLLGCVSKRVYREDMAKEQKSKQEESDLYVYLAEGLQKQNDELRQQLAENEKELNFYRKMYSNTMRIQRSVDPSKK